jgi:hypothetical protein
MAIAVPLHPAQGKGVHPGKLFPEYCRGFGGAPKSEKFTIGQGRDIFKTVQTGKYSSNDLCSAQLFCGWRVLPATRIWIAKIQHDGTAQY